jgi:hypothetical protein
MSAGETIWIYQDAASNCLIAKRLPFQYQSVLDPKTGDMNQIFTSGVEMICPEWSTLCVIGERTYATLDGVVYEITELLNSQNP